MFPASRYFPRFLMTEDQEELESLKRTVLKGGETRTNSRHMERR